MEYRHKKPSSTIKTPQRATTLKRPSPLNLQRQQQTSSLQGLAEGLQAWPAPLQRDLAQPALTALSLQRAEEQHLDAERQSLQRQAAELSAALPEHAVSAAVQRQAAARQRIQAPVRPQSASDWVTVMRSFAQQYEQVNARSGLDSREVAQYTALQRQTAHALVKQVNTSPKPAAERYAEFAEQAVTLQRHPMTANIPRAAIGFVNASERPALQRAVTEATDADALQRQQDEQALQLHGIQRQLAELDEQATQPVMQRIQARRGAGNPLPEAVQRHLEQGLNHDLSRVRIHDDAEAHKLSKAVNATAFTTGTDIFFRSGKFNPNTQSGLELLAHEVTHTVQQSQGKVGKGIDPDAGLEQEARAMGRKLAKAPISPGHGVRTVPAQTARVTGALQRQYHGPLAAPALAGQNLFLGGNGQHWADAGTAAQMSLQALPGRLGQQFKGMPPELLNGIQTMLRDSALVLMATTTLGAAVGAFFGGGGAVPGAIIGVEMGQAILTAWGLAAVVTTVKKQIDILAASTRSFLQISRAANGNPQRVKAASEALTNGLVIFADAVILAIGALLLKGGVKAFAQTRIGQRVGAKAANSPTVKWLDARQRMTSARQVAEPAVKSLLAQGMAQGRRLMGITEKLHKQGIKLASGVEKGIEMPVDPALARQAVQIGTVKMKLHPEYAALMSKIKAYGFQVEHKPGVAYIENIQRVNADYSPHSVDRKLIIDADARFLDLLHEFDHIIQIMVTFKGELWTSRFIIKPTGGWKLLDTNSNLKVNSTGRLMNESYNNALELHVRLKEFFRLVNSGADARLLAEHGVDLAERFFDYQKAMRNQDKWTSWGAENLPQFDTLIDQFKPLAETYSSGGK